MDSSGMVAVSVRELVHGYGDKTALENASLEVPVGAIVGLVGPNGAGKSTLINVLAGLIRPSAGSIEVLGYALPAQRTAAMSVTGWLLSEPALFQYLSPDETLSFLAAAYGLDSLTARERIRDLLLFFELDERDAGMADELSTGNLKRLALASAFIHAPRLLVLDEPFESLDPLMVRRLRQALVRYARGGGSVLLSSHLLDVVQGMCDHVYILDQGRIVFDGPGAPFRAGGDEAGDGGSLEVMYASLLAGLGRVDHQLSWL